ncbi:MAG: DUF4139 domain-containing protein [Candidatus Omnitrophota bacterium]|nr:DUF4139 domain-containing protein [Candidatus Omnitrophota bacterium]
MKKAMILILFGMLFNVAFSGTAEAVNKSPLGDQTSVEVTVYNNNLAFVKETRSPVLDVNGGELHWAGVAASLIPESVNVRAASSGGDFRILEQNFAYDLVGPGVLLEKYVGKKIKIVDWNEFQDRKETVEAILLSTNGPIYQIGEEIFIGHPGTQVLPGVPVDLITEPTLIWNYEIKSGQRRDLELSYLTTNISWKTDYVLVLGEDNQPAKLSAWVTLDNQSGTAYENARIKFVAGDVQRTSLAHKAVAMQARGMAFSGVAMESQFEEEDLFEYHVYNLDRRTSIKNNESKQLLLFEGDGVGVTKERRVVGAQGYYQGAAADEEQKEPVQVHLKFRNSKENGLGVPLPGGVMRVYARDAQGNQEFIGESQIAPTPKDEEVKLQVGRSFDVIAKKRQTDFQKLTTKMTESEWEITLNNHKKESADVVVMERMSGNWSLVSNSHPYEKTDAFTLKFPVSVPQNGEVKVRYRVRVGL